MILGVNISHNPSICLYENKKIKSFYNEERFINRKNFQPTSSNFEIFQSILQKITIVPKVVCYSSYGRFEPFTDEDYRIIQKIQNQLNNPKYYFDEKHHHIYHAITGFYFSEFNEAAAIIVDGGGACTYKIPFREVESIYKINKKNVNCIYKHSSSRQDYNGFFTNYNKTLEQYDYGFLHRYSQKAVGGWSFIEACRRTGFQDEDAGKLMGLSSYGNTEIKYDLNYDKVKIAKEVQEQTFKETCELIEKASHVSSNIVLSGGYFLNCSNNFKYVKQYPNLKFFVDPVPHDGGTAIGASIYYENYKR
jgi:carbamoyltransferase